MQKIRLAASPWHGVCSTFKTCGRQKMIFASRCTTCPTLQVSVRNWHDLNGPYFGSSSENCRFMKPGWVLDIGRMWHICSMTHPLIDALCLCTIRLFRPCLAAVLCYLCLARLLGWQAGYHRTKSAVWIWKSLCADCAAMHDAKYITLEHGRIVSTSQNTWSCWCRNYSMKTVSCSLSALWSSAESTHVGNNGLQWFHFHPDWSKSRLAPQQQCKICVLNVSFLPRVAKLW